jgi:hypothetical protein
LAVALVLAKGQAFQIDDTQPFGQQGESLLQAIEQGFTPRDGLDLERLRTYFSNVTEAALLLVSISEKELSGLARTAEEQLFLKSLVMEQAYAPGCGGVSFEEMWDGWYMHLIYGKDESPALIADVHTNPNNDPTSALYLPRVLHVGTGPTAALLMIVETVDGPTLFVGPAFAYYEFVETGFPPVRLNDAQWRDRLTNSAEYPMAPTWVQSFRFTADDPPTPFALPAHTNSSSK